MVLGEMRIGPGNRVRGLAEPDLFSGSYERIGEC